MNRILKLILIILACIGAIIGAGTYLWQVHIGNEAWGWNTMWQLPFLIGSGIIILPGVVVILLEMLGGVLELLDPNEHWPHN